MNNWITPVLNFALRSEGKKGENKTGMKFSLYIKSKGQNHKVIGPIVWKRIIK